MTIRKGISWKANKDGTFTIRLTLEEIAFLEQVLQDASHRAWEQSSALEMQARQIGEEWYDKTNPFYEKSTDFAIKCSDMRSTFESFIRYGPEKDAKKVEAEQS